MLLHRVKNTNGHIIGRAKGGDGGKLDAFLLHQPGKGSNDLLAGVQTQDISLRKLAIFHTRKPLSDKEPQTVIVCGFMA